METDSPVIKLCHTGIKEETQGRPDNALKEFMKAWHISTSNYEYCIVAHYIARFQKTAEDKYYWNKQALFNADLSEYNKVKEFYPSLYLNVAHSYEELGNFDQAIIHYNIASEKLTSLPENIYFETIRDAVTRGLSRINSGQSK